MTWKMPTGLAIARIIAIFKEKDINDVNLSATGNAIPKLIETVEVVKHRVPNIHQTNSISTIVVKDEYKPKADGVNIFVERDLAVLKINLSKVEPE